MNLNLTVPILITPKSSHEEKVFHERGKNIFNIIFYNRIIMRVEKRHVTLNQDQFHKHTQGKEIK